MSRRDRDRDPNRISLLIRNLPLDCRCAQAGGTERRPLLLLNRQLKQHRAAVPSSPPGSAVIAICIMMEPLPWLAAAPWQLPHLHPAPASCFSAPCPGPTTCATSLRSMERSVTCTCQRSAGAAAARGASTPNTSSSQGGWQHQLH